MTELGETTDPKQLIPGETVEIRKSTTHLLLYGQTLNQISDGMRGLDSSHWTGRAADTFRARFATEPTRWSNCGNAFLDAEAALESYCVALSWAQDEAGEAIRIWEQGQQAT